MDGVCGSGKTYTAIRKIAERVNAGESVIYATETVKLLNQTMEGLKGLDIPCDLVVADEKVSWRKSYQSVASEIVSAIEYSDEEPSVILCTTKSLIVAASNIPDDRRLSLYIDEGFEVAGHGEINCTTEGEPQGLAYLLGLTKEKPDNFVDENQASSDERLKLIKQAIANDVIDVTPQISPSKLQWIASLDLKAFASKFSDITLLAACHEDTIQFHAISASGCKQICLDWGLANSHTTDGMVYVFWVYENAEWRTTKIRNIADREMNSIRIAFELEHWSENYLSVKGMGGAGKPMSVKSHGFNHLSESPHLIDLHAQMPYPILSQFYKENYKLSDSQIRTACYHYDRYQAALRTSLRKSTVANPSTEDNYYCFGDKSTAMYFISKLAKSVTVEAYKLKVDLECDTSERKTPKHKVSNSKAQEAARSRDRKKFKELSPNMPRIEEALNSTRDWRVENPGKRVTKDIYMEKVEEFGE